MSTDIVQTTKYALDAGAIGVTIASIASWLPPTAAALSIIWLSIQIFDYFWKKKWKKKDKE